MNELRVDEIKQIEVEIRQEKIKLANSILKIGRLQLPKNSSIKQICNHVAPQLGLEPKDCINLVAIFRGEAE